MSGWLLVLLAATPTVWNANDAGERSKARAAAASLPINQRVLALSEGFKGAKYVVSPLGEGTGPDPDPLERYDAVDCLTFVEEVIALAIAPDDDHVLSTLTCLRYGPAEATYENRNHVMEAQWLPRNVDKGYLKDVARQYAKDFTRTASKKLTEENWQTTAGKSLNLSPSGQVRGTFNLDMVPVAHALEVLKTVPSGTVVVVIRADRPTQVTRISHVAFLVQGPKGPQLRHASRSFGKVVDEPAEKYLKRNLDYGAWTIEGLGLFEVRAP